MTSSEDPNVGAAVAAQTLSRVSGLQRQIQELRRNYRDREDLPGMNMLLAMLDLICEAAREKVVAESRKVPQTYALPEADQSVGDIPLSDVLEPLTTSITELEIELETWRDLIEAPQGQTFDAIAEPYIGLTKSLPDGEKVELIFRPVPVCRYQVYLNVTPKFQKTATSIRPALKRRLEALPRLMAIEYPATFESDTFMHAAIAHEVGHIALVLGKWDDRIWTRAWVDAGLSTEEARRQRKVWEELACDYLGLNLIGPAYALSLVDFHFANNTWQDTSGYPAFTWRLERMRAAVEPYFSGVTGDVPLRAKELVEQWLGLLPAEAEIAMPAVTAALEQVEGNVDEILDEARYTEQQFTEELRPVWAKLEQRIAPAELVYERDCQRGQVSPNIWSKPLDWRSILNGGYLHLLNGHPLAGVPLRGTEASDRNEIRSKACALIQGSIELSQLHSAMLLQRAELAGLEID